MENIYSYVREKGDILFSQSPLNEADNLVFSVVCYLDLAEEIPAPGAGKVTLLDAARCYFRKHGIPKTCIDDGSNSADALQHLFLRMALAPRYRDMKLFAYVNKLVPEKVEQFSAFCIQYDENHIFVVYRGTSDSLVGWKEDFLLAVTGEIASQKDASAYLKYVGKKNPDCLFELGGHSKGGHLAMYAAASAPRQLRKRILRIWSNDGPGLDKRFQNTEGFREIERKIRYYVPEASIASTLYPYGVNYHVIASTAKGLVQHDAKTWIIRDGRFVDLDRRKEKSIRAERKVRRWVHRFTREDLLHFTDVFFDMLYATGARTFPEIGSLGRGSVKQALARAWKLPGRDKFWLGRFLVLLGQTAFRVK